MVSCCRLLSFCRGLSSCRAMSSCYTVLSSFYSVVIISCRVVAYFLLIIWRQVEKPEILITVHFVQLRMTTLPGPQEAGLSIGSGSARIQNFWLDPDTCRFRLERGNCAFKYDENIM